MRMRGLVTGALALCLGAAIVPALAQEPIKVGLLEDVSGDLALIGLPKLHGSELAVEEINAAGGIMGRPIELIHLDPQGDNARYQEFARRLLSRDKVDVLIGGITSASREAVRPIIESIPGREPADRLLRLMEVLAVLATDSDRAPIAGPGSDRLSVASPDQPRIERVLDHIHAHYREPISVAALAGIAALSPSGFHRLFRRHTSLTVTAYAAELRIGQACALLVNTERPIAHVAEAVGYANLANFNRQFRAAKGMTPRDFRRSFVR